MFGKVRERGFIIAVAAVVAATVIFCSLAFACSRGEIEFEADYYFVCYRTADNSVSASSLSDTVASYGGAGYILDYDGSYYITVSCYYSDNDAQSVCESLKRRDLDCMVLDVEIDGVPMTGFSSRKNAQLYKGNLVTLDSLSRMAFECANGLDTGEFNQTKAKDVLSAVESGLYGLLKNNSGNSFTDGLNYVIAECEDKGSGYLYSKDMRRIQIAITDLIINVKI